MEAQSVDRESAAANGECQCAEVLCGGVALAQNQGCCNGRPFTLGTQGCCHGVIADAMTPCECDGESIDLSTAGCCGQDNTEQDFDPALQACCQQPVTQEGCEGSVSTTSTFNYGFDCCPGPVAAESELCDGQCVGSECAASGCCQCGGCFAGPACAAGGQIVEGFAISCIVGCFAQACTEIELTQLANGICTEGGSCVSETPAPAVSRGGVLLAAAVLLIGGWLGLARMRKQRGA